MAKCKNLSMEGVSGTKRDVKCTWRCAAQHVDHYRFKFWIHTAKNGWILNGEGTTPSRSFVYSVPANYKIDKIRFHVCAVAAKTKEVTVGEGDKKKTTYVVWWTDRFAESNHALPANVKKDNRANDEKEQAAKSGWSKHNAGLRNLDRAAAAKGSTAVHYYLAAASCFDEAAGFFKTAGLASPRSEALEGRKIARKLAKSSSAVFIKTQLGLAAKHAKEAAGLVGAAASLRKSYKFAAAAGKEKSAKALYDKAVLECQAVVDLDGVSDGNKAKANQLKSGYNSASTSCANRANSDAGDNTEAYATTPVAPSAPNVTASAKSNGSCTLKMTMDVPAIWAAYVEVQVQIDGGAWKSYGGNLVGKKLGLAASALTATYTGSAGHRYRFRARALLAGKDYPSAWVYSETVHAQPSQPKNLALKALSTTSVQASWNNTGKAGTSVEVQYSTWFQGGNAWAKNAAAEIKTVELPASSTSYTITGLEPGVKLYVRVKRVSAAGGAWALVKGSTTAVTAACTPPKASSALASLTGLKAVLLGDGRTVKLTWSGAVETGAAVKVEHTSRKDAFANNVADAIEVEAYDPPSVSAKSHVFSMSDLDAGATHWIRVTKTLDAGAVTATCAAGAWRASATVAKVAIPAAASSTATVPSGLTLSSPYEGAVRAEWADTCGAGETYELQHTANAEAYADNAYGDITTTSYDEPTVGAARHVYTLTGLEPGTTYWIRVRKKDGDGASAWSGSVEVTLAPSSASTEDLSAPTPARNDAAYETGSVVPLSWIHNSAEDSDQGAYELQLGVTDAGGSRAEQTVTGGSDNAYALDLGGVEAVDGCTVDWCVRTAGTVAGAWSPWSERQTFRVVAPPVAGVALADGAGTPVGESALAVLPLAVTVTANVGTGDAPVQWRAAIIAATTHETVAPDGSPETVQAGEEVWSGSLMAGEEGFDVAGAVFAVGGRDIALDEGQGYTVVASVYTSAGMSGATDPLPFLVEWGDEMPEPSGVAVFDGDDYTCRVFPACWVPDADEDDSGGEDVSDEQQAAEAGEDDSVVTDAEIAETLAEIEAEEPDEGVFYPDIDEGDPYYSAAADEDEEYGTLRAGTELDVYRVDYDSGTTLIASGLPNNGRASCIDPHPNFGTTTYRIVAHDTTKDIQSSAEVDAISDVESLVITWDESWDADDTGDYAEYRGRRLALSIDLTSDEAPQRDSAILKLAGDRFGTLYEGTAGEFVVQYKVKYLFADAATRQALRRLVGKLAYVRDPLGLGFWALVTARLGHDSPPFATADITAQRVMAPKEA